ncbi:MAG: aspartate/glutamate racemase family protein, partial [Chloroflexales bacterium]
MSIGLFDSGLGGLSVARAVRAALPTHDLIYLADTAYCPYGPLPVAQVRTRALACARWLVGRGARVVVVACNTATSAAVELLRTSLAVPVVGMEPGLKPAVAATRTGRVAVLATSGTLTGERFARLVERFGARVEVRTVACPAMVRLVEAG